MPVKRIARCAGCGNRIDPDLCHCGDSIDSHGLGSGHGPVPYGCTCGYVKTGAKLVKRSGWSDAVRKRLDPQRPKYTAAVKSLAAFAKTESVFALLVSRLDDACKEATLVPLFDDER